MNKSLRGLSIFFAVWAVLSALFPIIFPDDDTSVAMGLFVALLLGALAYWLNVRSKKHLKKGTKSKE